MSARVVSFSGTAPTISSAVTVGHLTKSYGRLTALADVSLSIRAGEVLGLIGPNGAGKTTLFECVAGVLPYEAGRISVDGKELSPRQRSSHVFYIPDAIAPWPAQTVRWALEFTIGFFGGSADRRNEVVERLDLGPLLGSTIGTLSKGQRKRAVLAVGMLTPHPLLLTDEPFDGLDLRQTREVGAALRARAADGRTLFLSIHQITDAARVCDRFVLLSGGRVRGEGTVEELARSVNPNPLNPLNPLNLEDIFLALT
jgi:ABC-type multidrug transport system ATPase subunit